MTATFDPDSVRWALDLDRFREMYHDLRTASEVAFDLETTGLDQYATEGGETNGGVAARIVLASFTLAGGERTWLLPLSHPESPWRSSWAKTYRLAVQALAEVPLIAHHAKFDLKWTTAHTGTDLGSNLVWDTLLSSKLLDENSSARLKTRAARTFGIEEWDDFDLSKPGAAETVPMYQLGIYAAQDTYWTWRLAENHRWRMFIGESENVEPDGPEEIEEFRLGQLMQAVSLPTTKTLAHIESRGMLLDAAEARRAIEGMEEVRDRVSSSLIARYAIEGTPSFAPTSKYFRAWADAAVQAGDLRVDSLTPKGAPSWGKKTLSRLSHAGFTLADELTELRKATKRLEYLRAWLSFAGPDGRVRATYNDGTVVTGRLSSSGPNMQQVTYALRPTFIPSPGRLLVELDYSQIELRIGAALSGCEPMKAAFVRGDDLHTLLASRITGKPPEEVTKEDRQKGKSANFGLIFGMGAHGFQEYAETAYGVMLSEEEAFQVHATFFEMWEGIEPWHRRQERLARAWGQVTSPLGRVRRVPDVWSGYEPDVARAERQSINSPVQGTASDLMQLAAAWVDGNLPGREGVPDVWTVGTVHDSLVFEVPEQGWEVPVREVRRRMESIGEVSQALLGWAPDVPLVADPQVSTRWGLGDVPVPADL